MTIALATLCLNEMEWLPKLYEQHKNWPGLTKWVFVEATDTVYATTNPLMITNKGLSTDGTTEFLEQLAATDDRIVHIKQGFSCHKDPAQGKCIARQQYLKEIDKVKPRYFVVVDADEFYPQITQEELESVALSFPLFTSYAMKHREIWRPPSIADNPLFELEVSGGFWSIPYCRVWKWMNGLVYLNHNTPSKNGRGLDWKIKRFDTLRPDFYFVHTGFAASRKTREAKNDYYAARGESKDAKRSWYVESRACFSTWKPGDSLPRNAVVIPYTGIVPECFQ